MIHFIVNLCHQYPQILLFLAIAIGYFLGAIKFRGFKLGSTTCVLLTALVLGQMNIEIPELLRSISFALFAFCIGYKVGPQFFGALRKEGLKYIGISLVVAIVGLATALFLGKILGFDKGTTAGLFAGSMTQSAAIGTAEGAIAHLSISAPDKASLNTNVAVAYAITYVFGTAGMLIFLKIVPKFMKVNLKEESRKMEEEMSGGAAVTERPELFSLSGQLNLRAYNVTNQNVVGKTIKEIEALFPGRIAIDKIKSGREVTKAAPDTVVKSNDVIAMVGKREQFLKAEGIVGPEVDDKDVTDIMGEILEICVLNPEVVGKTLGKLSEKGRGIFLKKITRQGHEIPITRDTVVSKCDVFQIVGDEDDIERAVKYLGYPERPTAITDLIMLGLGCVLGTLVGLIAVPLFGIPITLGVGGGVLISGVVFGWLRSIHPTFGQIPSPAQWLLTDLGLNLFVACVGLTAGTQAVHALKTTGGSVFFAGIILSLLPVIAGLLFGKFVLKMNPVLLLGAVAGARVLTAAINMLQEEADSSIPVLGYAAPYAFGNVLLTIWGAVIVNVM